MAAEDPRTAADRAWAAQRRQANGAGGSEAFTLVNAAELVAREFTEPKWAVPQIIAEGLSILAGKPKTGKSWAALDFAIAVAGGYPALGNIACEQGEVLLLALEDNDRRLHQRLKAVLQGKPPPAELDIATQWRRADAGGLVDLQTWVNGHPRARLVEIDTLQKIRGQRSKNDGVYADDYQAIGDLKGLADKTGVPFIVVHHLRKEAAGDPLESVSGTAGLTGSADTILVLKREPKDSFGLLYVRGRDVPEAEIAMQFDEATGKWLRLIGADDFRRSKERNAIIRALIDLNEPMTPAEIADAIGKPRANSSVRVLLYKMHKTGDVVKCADGRYTASRYKVVRVGRRTLVPVDSAKAWLASLPEGVAGEPAAPRLARLARRRLDETRRTNCDDKLTIPSGHLRTSGSDAVGSKGARARPKNPSVRTSRDASASS
jgi:AAA domain